jgi:hypothetical protein
MVPISRVSSDHRRRQNSLGERAPDLKGVLLFVACHEVNGAATHGSFEFVAVELATQL